MAWRRRSMSLGLYTVWEVLGRGWDPAPGQNGKLHHYLNLGTMDRRDPDVEPTELGQPNALQSLDWENPLLADNPLPLTLENIAGRAKGQRPVDGPTTWHQEEQECRDSTEDPPYTTTWKRTWHLSQIDLWRQPTWLLATDRRDLLYQEKTLSQEELWVELVTTVCYRATPAPNQPSLWQSTINLVQDVRQKEGRTV